MKPRLLIDSRPFKSNRYRDRHGLLLDGQPLEHCEALPAEGDRFRLMVGRKAEEVLKLPLDDFDPLIQRIFFSWDLPPGGRVVLRSWSLDLARRQLEVSARFDALGELPQLRSDIQERLQAAFSKEPLSLGFFEENFFDERAYLFYLPSKQSLYSTMRSWLPPLQAAWAEAVGGL